MPKNLAFALLGFLLGATTISLLYRQSRSQAPIESFPPSVQVEPRSSNEVQGDLVFRLVPQQNPLDVPDDASAADNAAARYRSSVRNPISAAATDPGGSAGVRQRSGADEDADSQSSKQSEPPPAQIGDATLLPLLPEAYYSLLEPPNRRALAPHELAARFAGEPRDEAWAYTMELGMNQHIAGSPNLGGTVIEYVECRTTACLMAGYVEPGFENTSQNLIREMSTTGWWQLSPGTMTRMSLDDGVPRFVHVIPRTQDAFFEDAQPGAPGNSGNSPTQSITLGYIRAPASPDAGE